MIIVTARVPVHAEKIDGALNLVQTLTTASLAEPGCLSYRFYRDLLEPNIIFVFEEWESEAALDAHLGSPHMTLFRLQMPRFIAGELVTQIYTVSSVSPL